MDENSDLLHFLHEIPLNPLQLLQPVLVDNLADMRGTAYACELHLVRLSVDIARLHLSPQHTQVVSVRLFLLLPFHLVAFCQRLTLNTSVSTISCIFPRS
jgi:hypothetical protein